MKKGFIAFCFVMMCFASVCFAESTEIDFDTVRERYAEYYISGNTLPDVTALSYLETMNDDGSFSDITYGNRDISKSWGHLQRIARMSATASVEGSALNLRKEETYTAIAKGLRYWYSVYGQPMNSDGSLKVSSSWWSDTIGQSMQLMPLYFTAYGKIDKDAYDIAVNYLYSAEDMIKYPEFLTGANLTWYAAQGIVEGLVTNNITLITGSYEKMMKEAEISTDPYAEGFQTDGSFHQHGQNFYPGYATNFMLDFLRHTKMLRGFVNENDEIINTIGNSILDGYRWIYRGAALNPNLLGRQITDKVIGGAKADNSLYEVCSLLVELGADKSEDIEKFGKYVKSANDTLPPVNGNKYLWCSDIMSHNRDEYSVVVGMVSDRTIGTECNATQNIYGQYMRFGTVFMTKNDDNFYGFPVYMNWARLPGTTTPDNVEKITYSGTFMSQREKFVGGVSDGEYGANAMKMSKFQTKANKAWFWFDEGYVALGSNISSTRRDINTTVDQRFMKTSVMVDGDEINEGENKYSNVSYVNENNIGYIFPNGEDIEIKNMSVSGAWSDISGSSDADQSVYENKAFTLMIPHGDFPKCDSYEYIVLPQATAEETKTYAKNNPIKIIENSKNVQAVYHSGTDVGYAVFYEGGECRLSSECVIKTNKPCILMVRKTGDGYNVSVANPEQKKEKISVTLNGKTQIFNMKYTAYGESEMGGSTVSMKF